ncbi:DUF924 family protein [soil metagenome]
METIASIHSYWFGSEVDDILVAQRQSKLWWSKDRDTDHEIRNRFESTVTSAAEGGLSEWAESPRGLLALLLLTDQFPRNIYRGMPEAFAFDSLAQQWSKSGLASGMDRKLRPIERVFFYLPLEHSELLADQEHSVQLFTQLYQDVAEDHMDTFRGFLMFALRHRRVIERFGRFPHRNQILGRISTPEEVEFLKEPGSSF